MKKKLIGLVLAVIMVMSFVLTVTGCTTGEELSYSITVLYEDDSPAEGVTVNWSSSGTKRGSAVTDAEGNATVTLVSGTYEVTLENYGEELDYTTVSVTANTRNLTLNLTAKQVEYSVTVTGTNGLPVQNATVSWISGGTTAGTAKTNSNGVATCMLAYGTYSVTLSGLPANMVAGGAQTATGASPAVNVTLTAGNTKEYTVTAKTEGGLLFPNIALNVYKGDTLIASGTTDDEGKYTFMLEPDEYTVKAPALPAGYTAEDISILKDAPDAQINLVSKVIPLNLANDDTRYVTGSIIHDYTFTTPYEINGARKTVTISELLETKKAILINNWGTQCTWCVQEMPAMEEVYAKYSDDIEIIAVSNYYGGDSDAAIIDYYQKNGYSFPMMRDTYNLSTKFSLSGWPTTIVIDRYGAVARIEVGAVTSVGVWERMIDGFISDTYTQTFTPGLIQSPSISTEVSKPDVELAADHYDQIANTLNNTATFPEGASVVYYGETQSEFAWPYVIDTVPGVSPEEKVVFASNSNKDNSMAILYADVTVPAGKVFTFDYYSDTESDDVVSFVWDGKVVNTISGDSKGWQTCKLYADLTEEKHTLGIAYIKNNSSSTEKDNVFIRNVRFTETADLNSQNILRAAAYGGPDSTGMKYTYYAKAEIGADSYYHVDVSALQNSQFAGNDEKPMLFANLLTATNWAGLSVRDIIYAVDDKTGEYAYNLEFNINGVNKDYREELTNYIRSATYSDIPNYAPVDKELKDLLTAFITRINSTAGKASHEDEWLELCYFYSHYGEGETISNPIMGLTDKTAYTATVGVNHADMTKLIAPFSSTIFKFVPEESGVYLIKTLIPENTVAQESSQIWLYCNDADEKFEVYSGSNYLTMDGKDEYNSKIYRYLTAGKTYYLQTAFQMLALGEYDFEISRVGDSASVMEPTAPLIYTMVIDDLGNFNGEVYLAGAVNYEKDEDGYYHAMNKDGTRGSFIYLDVNNLVAAMSDYYTITQMIDKYTPNPMADATGPLDYKIFDFRYRVGFTPDSQNSDMLVFYPKIDVQYLGEQYKDYTEIIRDYATKANAETNGLVKVNEEIRTFLHLFSELRLDSGTEKVLENEFLRFCWYERVYDANNK